MKRGVWLAVGAAALSVLAVVAVGREDGGAAASRPSTGQQPLTLFPLQERGPAMELTGVDLAGEPVDVAALRGGPVVLNVWGSWCGPCRTEAPVLAKVSTAYADTGVRVLGINVKDTVAAAAAFERRYAIQYPSVDDRQGRASLAIAQYVPSSVVPATLVLDRQGRVAARVLGAVTSSTLRGLLDDVLAEP